MQRLAYLGIALGCILVVGVPKQSDFYLIFSLVSIAFASFFYLVYTSNKSQITWIIFTGLLVRGALIFIFPNLSDDIYRFIWDGHLMHLGINPFEFTPTDVPNKDVKLEALYPLLNSKDYFSIYPPVSQIVFYLSDLGMSQMQSSAIIKSIFFAFECGTLLLLLKLLEAFSMPKEHVLWYWLNPLIMIELIGNLHFEALMVFFVLLCIYGIKKGKAAIAGLAYGLSIATKLLPLMFGPLWLVYLLRAKKLIPFALSSISICLLLFVGFLWNDGILNMGTSVDLYFQKFEYNASFYYFFRALGQWIVGYNLIHIIGPVLSLLAMVIIFGLTKWVKKNELLLLIHLFFITFSIYLLLATTVHPWYLTMILALNVFLGYRFVWAWSYLIFLSYSTYQNIPYAENLMLVSIEYLLVFMVFVKYDWPTLGFKPNKNKLKEIISR